MVIFGNLGEVLEGQINSVRHFHVDDNGRFGIIGNGSKEKVVTVHLDVNAGFTDGGADRQVNGHCFILSIVTENYGQI